MKTAELCGVCAAKYRDGGLLLIRTAGGVNNKVTCSACGKRRYGATYEIKKGVTKHGR